MHPRLGQDVRNACNALRFLPVIGSTLSASVFIRSSVATCPVSTAKVRRFGVIFISHELPNALGATNRVVVRRLGTIMRETPALEFTAESMLGTISGLHVAKESFPVAEKSRTALLVRCIN